MFLSEVLICSCLAIHHIVKEKWSLVIYLNPANLHLAWITKADKDVTKRLDFKDIKSPLRIRDIDNIEKKNPLVLMF